MPTLTAYEQGRVMYSLTEFGKNPWSHFGGTQFFTYLLHFRPLPPDYLRFAENIKPHVSLPYIIGYCNTNELTSIEFSLSALRTAFICAIACSSCCIFSWVSPSRSRWEEAVDMTDSDSCCVNNHFWNRKYYLSSLSIEHQTGTNKKFQNRLNLMS